MHLKCLAQARRLGLFIHPGCRLAIKPNILKSGQLGRWRPYQSSTRSCLVKFKVTRVCHCYLPHQARPPPLFEHTRAARRRRHIAAVRRPKSEGATNQTTARRNCGAHSSRPAASRSPTQARSAAPRVRQASQRLRGCRAGRIGVIATKANTCAIPKLPKLSHSLNALGFEI